MRLRPSTYPTAFRGGVRPKACDNRLCISIETLFLGFKGVARLISVRLNF